MNVYDHQFYPAKVLELYELEKNYYRKQVHYKVPLKAGTDEASQKENELEQKLEQEEIENSRPLTDEEKQLKEELMQKGYSNWNRRDFHHFILLSTKYGRNSIRLIALEFEDKTEEEVREYAKAFWQNYQEIDGYERYINQIEQGEEKIIKVKIQKEALRRKLSQYRYPLQELVLKFPPASTNKRVFSEEEDRFCWYNYTGLALTCPMCMIVFEKQYDNLRYFNLISFSKAEMLVRYLEGVTHYWDVY